MSRSEYEIDVPDDLWEAAWAASGVTDPTELVELALRELLEREKLKRGDCEPTP